MKFLLREKPARILLTLKDTASTWYLSRLARTSGVSFVHLIKLVPVLEQNHLVKVEKSGKRRLIMLTNRGAEIIQILEELKRKFEPPKQQPTQP